MRFIDPEVWKLDLLLFHGCNEKTAWIIDRINHAPTVDAVPVIRCKDCAGWNEEEQHSCTDGMEANDYCSHAEHKKRTIEERLKRYKNRSEENGE